MDLFKSIKVFREVCEHMSFSQAAEKLNLVPSAVSRQINELEKFLGVRLLERTTRSIRLTDDGKRYLGKMDVINHNVQELVNSSAKKGNVEGHIRITCPAVLGAYFLSGVIDSFLKEHTSVSISTKFVNGRVNLIEEDFDMALRVGHLSDSNLISRLIGQFPLTVVASEDYLKRKKTPIHPRDLVKHNCLLNSQFRTPKRWQFRHQNSVLSTKVNGNYEANDDQMLLSLACAGYGIAYLPSILTKQHLKSGELVSLMEDYLPDPLPISIIYPSRDHLSTAKQLLIQSIVAQAERLALQS